MLGHRAGVGGADTGVRAVNPKRRRYDERVAQETVRNKVTEALRRLSTLGFVEILEDERIRLRPALMRFAEPVRGAKAPDEALARLVAEGELVLAEDESAQDADGEADGEGEIEAEPAGEVEGGPEAEIAGEPEREARTDVEGEGREREVDAEGWPPEETS